MWKRHLGPWLVKCVEKTFRAMTGEMRGKDFRKILKITKHIKIQHEPFLNPRQRYKYFQYLLQKEKVYLIGRFPSSPIYLVKNLRSTSLYTLFNFTAYYNPLNLGCLQLFTTLKVSSSIIWRRKNIFSPPSDSKHPVPLTVQADLSTRYTPRLSPVHYSLV